MALAPRRQWTRSLMGLPGVWPALVLAAVVGQTGMNSVGQRAHLLNPSLHELGCGPRVAVLLPG